MSRLQVAVRDPSTWRHIEGFDEALKGALKDVGTDQDIPVALLPSMREIFAGVWLEVLRHEEAERQRAIEWLGAASLARSPAQVQVARPGRAYVAAEGDITLGELVRMYRAERIEEHGEESTDRKYKHIFTALEEVLGAEKPIRAISASDCKSVRAALRQLSTNMNKRFPGVGMLGAIAAASEEDEPRLLAPNTVNSCMSGLVRILYYAVKSELRVGSGS